MSEKVIGKREGNPNMKEMVAETHQALKSRRERKAVGEGVDAIMCDGMRKNGMCGNAYCDNHNKFCRGVMTCPDRFHYPGVGWGSDGTKNGGAK